MAPCSHVMDDDEVAAVVSYLRVSWGDRAPPVSASDVNRYRSTPHLAPRSTDPALCAPQPLGPSNAGSAIVPYRTPVAPRGAIVT